MTAVVEQFEQRVIDGGADAPTGDDALALAEAVKRLAVGDVPRALRVTEAMVDRAPEGGLVRVHWLSARAHVLCYANRFEEALDALGRAAEVAMALDDQRSLGQVNLTRVQALARLGRLEEADRAAQASREAFALASDAVGEGKACLNHGIVLRMRGRVEAAVRAFEHAEPRVGDDAFLLGALASNRAEALLDIDRFADAEQAFALARDLFGRAGQGHAAAIVEGNLADLLSREGRLDAALEAFEHARLAFEASGASADVARLQAEQAEALATLGAADDAATAYGRAIPALEAAGLRRELARARLGMGLTLMSLGARDEARTVLEAAGADLLALNSDVLADVCMIARAELTIREGKVDAGLALAERGLDRLRATPVRLAQARAGLAEALLARGRVDDADSQLTALQSEASSGALLPLRSRAAHLRGTVELRRGRTSEGLAALRRALADAEQLRGSIRAESLRLAFGQSWRGLYHDVCSAALDAGELAVAFDALERLRSRTMLEALGSESGSAPVSDDEHERLRAAHRQCVHELSVLYTRAGLGVGLRADARDDGARLSELERRASDLGKRLEVLEGRGPLPREPLTLDAACGALPDRTAALLLMPEGDTLSVLALTRGAALGRRRIAPMGELRAVLRRLRFALQALLRAGEPDAASRQLWDTLLGRLSSLLLEPLADVLRGAERVGISAFGDLEGVPWAVLPWDGATLGERVCLASLPGLTIAHALSRLAAEAERGGPGALLAVGVADEVAPGMEREAEAVASGAGDVAMVGLSATAEAVLAAAGRFDTLHLATHCVYSSISPLSSRLRLADRWVTARELTGAVRPGATVVLAGCESGRSGGVAEDDRQGLIRALLASGAARVLATHWPLHDHTSCAMMPMLHAARRASPGGAALALRDAQRHQTSLGTPPWLHGAIFLTGALP